MAKRKQQSRPHSTRVVNRKARHDYHILEVVECGIELTGTEVKSLRSGGCKIEDAYARLKNGELFLVGANIAPYAQAAAGMQHPSTRDRKLLVHRRQIYQITSHIAQKGRTIVPLTIYFHRGWAKCELGVAIGKRSYDKRDTIKKRDQQREIEREMSRRKRL